MVSIDKQQSIDDTFDEALLARARVALEADVAAQAAKLPGGWEYRLFPGHPLTVLAARVTRSLVESGFVVHDCVSQERTGGVCLTPSVPVGGVLITWSVHTALRLDPARFGRSVAACEVMNYALADVLRGLGWSVDTFGQASAHIVTLQGMAAR